jgi:hypothetical protein
MAASDTSGILSISIDASTSPGKTDTRTSAVHSIVMELIDRCDVHRIPVTLALANPVGSEMARRVSSGASSHEIALLVEGDVVSRKASRTEILRRIIRPLQAAASTGIAVTSLASTGLWHLQHIDLLVRHGVTILRGPKTNTGLQSPCYGLWLVPTAASFGGGGVLQGFVHVSRARRALRQVETGRGIVHVRIDAAGIAARGGRDIGSVEKLLKSAAARRDQSRLVITTLRATAARLLPKRPAAAHSILRAA